MVAQNEISSALSQTLDNTEKKIHSVFKQKQTVHNKSNLYFQIHYFDTAKSIIAKEILDATPKQTLALK